MKCIHIYKDGTMDELDLSSKKRVLNNLSSHFMKKSKSQGEGDIKELYKWSYENKTIQCFSWYDGEAGFENKHDLPPGGISTFLEEDSSVQLLYGDIFIVGLNDGSILDFQISDYGVFYNFVFGGFDDCESESEAEIADSETEEEDIEDNTDEEYEILSDGNGDLDIDCNEY